MFLQARPLTGLVLIVALVPTHAVAQTVPFAELSGHITLGDTVSMTGADGGRAEGKIAELTTSSLTLLVNETERRTFAAATIRRIEVRDSLVNGAIIGLAAGAIPGAVLGHGFSRYCENESSSCPSAPFVIGALFGGLGAAIGAGIDGLIRTRVTISRPSVVTVTVSPVIDTGRQGMLMSIRF